MPPPRGSDRGKINRSWVPSPPPEHMKQETVSLPTHLSYEGVLKTPLAAFPSLGAHLGVCSSQHSPERQNQQDVRVCVCVYTDLF